MNILLIAPASGPWRKVGRRRVFNGKTFRFSMLSLLSVAAETPDKHRVRIIDEQIEEIPWDAPVDLVGITCMTALAPRAYLIADLFRTRGIPVVLGGMHPTFCPEEALRHADAVVAGEAEGIWQRVIDDAKAGTLSGVYKREAPADLSKLRLPDRSLLDPRRYSTVHAVQATRGCPNRCRFCAVTAFHGNAFRQRPVEQVIEEIESIEDRFFIFVDDNLTADLDYARSLFEALLPLQKHWVTQSSLSVAEDEDLVRLAAEAGCVGLFVGIETFDEQNLTSQEKGFNKVEAYREQIGTLHKYGIGVEAGIVFGFDNDTPQVFRDTLRMLDRLEIDAVQVSVRTPLPGTPVLEEMEPRLIDRDWADYDFHKVVFRPAGMVSTELQAGHDWVTREFYRPWRIARRTSRWLRRPRGASTLKYMLAVNIAYFGRIRSWGIKGWDPSGKSTRIANAFSASREGRQVIEVR